MGLEPFLSERRVKELEEENEDKEVTFNYGSFNLKNSFF